jgi:hypothetical protein
MKKKWNYIAEKDSITIVAPNMSHYFELKINKRGISVVKKSRECPLESNQCNQQLPETIKSFYRSTPKSSF